MGTVTVSNQRQEMVGLPEHKTGPLGRLREWLQARKQRAAEKAYRDHEGGVTRDGQRQDGFTEGVPESTHPLGRGGVGGASS